MVKLNNRKYILIIALVAIVVIGLSTAVVSLVKSDNKRLAGLLEGSVPVGVAKAKQECLKEGLSQKTCGSITASANPSECFGQGCWIVYAHAADRDVYRAGIRVGMVGDDYKVIDYLRDPNASKPENN